MTEDDLTPRQVEFRERLGALLTEFANAVGPNFDENEDEGLPMEMPVPVAWILITDWDDVGGDNESSTVVFNSETRHTQRVGMLRLAYGMALEEV